MHLVNNQAGGWKCLWCEQLKERLVYSNSRDTAICTDCIDEAYKAADTDWDLTKVRNNHT